MAADLPKALPLIAIVEDDCAVLNSLEFALQSEGYAVRGFERWTDAVASPEVLEADCLVADYAMPGLTGVGLLSRLRANGLACPAIVIASNPGERCRREVEAAGALLVEKPLLGGALGAHIRAALAPPTPKPRHIRH